MRFMMSHNRGHNVTKILAATFFLLAGCAGSQPAIQTTKECRPATSNLYCEGPDNDLRCQCISRERFDQFVDELHGDDRWE